MKIATWRRNVRILQECQEDASDLDVVRGGEVLGGAQETAVDVLALARGDVLVFQRLLHCVEELEHGRGHLLMPLGHSPSAGFSLLLPLLERKYGRGQRTEDRGQRTDLLRHVPGDGRLGAQRRGLLGASVKVEAGADQLACVLTVNEDVW